MSGDILRFASIKFQERYILNPTKDRYADIENLINEFRSDQLPYITQYSSNHKKAILKFSEIFHKNINSEFYTRYKTACKAGNKKEIANIVYNDPSWVAVRNAAIQCIKTLRISLEQWEKSEGLIP